MAVIDRALGLSKTFVCFPWLVDLYLFFVCAGKEHAVNLVTVWSVHKELFSFKCLGQDVPRLVKPSKNKLTAVTATTASGTGPNRSLQILCELIQFFNIRFVGLILGYHRDHLP